MTRFPYAPQGPALAGSEVPALVVQALSVSHAGGTVPALHDISLRVPSGVRMALVGPNGAGKSTLLKAIAGLLPSRAGVIQLYGESVERSRHRVAYLAQRSGVDWSFPISVRRLVLMGRYVHLGWLRWPGAADQAIVQRVLARLRLEDLAERPISDLSGGQQQRVLLARALAQGADLLLLDEPLNAVDRDTREIISAVLAELSAQGKSALIATHEVERLSSDFDSALYLRDGREVEPPPGAFVGRRQPERGGSSLPSANAPERGRISPLWQD